MQVIRLLSINLVSQALTSAYSIFNLPVISA